jgi:hypothetical protein
MLNEFLDLKAWAEWFAALDREFIFLLALPFVVAIIGLWAWWVDRDEDVYEARTAQAAEPERRQGERRGASGSLHHGLR